MAPSSYSYTPLSFASSPSRRGLVLLLLISFAFLLFLLPSFFSPSLRPSLPSLPSFLSPNAQPLTPPSNASDLVTWLYAHDRTPSNERPLIVTLGNRRYLPSIRNFHLRLATWGLHSDFVVLCLDRACARDDEVHDYGFPGYVGESIAFTKFHSNLDLIDSNYSFVFLDADVYLPSSLSPLTSMRSLSDLTWDVQFQADSPWWPVHNPPLNIGWYMVRAGESGREFIRRSMERWRDRGGWDQGVMNDIRREMADEESLRVSLVDPVLYKNFMLFDFKSHDWLFGHPSRIHRFTQESAILHFTCVEQPLKEYFGRELSGFADSPAGYYTSPSRLVLRFVDIAGWAEELHAQVALALALAGKRAVVWPHTVNLTWSATDTRPLFPGVRALSFASAQQAGYDVLEGRYLENRRALVGEEEPGWGEGEDVRLNVREYLDVDQGDGLDWSALVGAVERLEWAPILTLNMSGVFPPITAPDENEPALNSESPSPRSAPPSITSRLARLAEQAPELANVMANVQVCPMLVHGNDGGCWVCEEAPHPAVGLQGSLDQDEDEDE